MSNIYSFLNNIFKDATNDNNNNTVNMIVNILDATAKVVDIVDRHDNNQSNDISKNIQYTIKTATRFLNNLPTLTDEDMKEYTKETYDILDKVDLTGNTKLKSYLNFAENYIDGKYDEYTDITIIHDYIVRKLEEYNNIEIDLVRNEIKKYINMNVPMSRVERLSNKDKVNKLEKKIDELLKNANINEYINDVNDIIMEFNDLKPSIKIVNINDNNSENNISDKYRQNVIDEYIKIARKYFDLRLSKLENNKSNNTCTTCGYKFSESIKELDCCPMCGVTLVKYMTSMPNIDARLTNYIQTYNHEGNFAKFINRILCITNSIDLESIETVKKYFDDNAKNMVIFDDDLPLCSDICNMSPDKNGRRGPYTIKDIFVALKDLNLVKYEPDVNYIAHIIWNWDLPKYEHIYDNIMIDRDTVYNIFQSIKDKYDQRSNLNNWYLSYRLLQRNGFEPCNEVDFKILKTDKTIKKYENIWEEICRLAYWSPPKPIYLINFS